MQPIPLAKRVVFTEDTSTTPTHHQHKSRRPNFHFSNESPAAETMSDESTTTTITKAPPPPLTLSTTASGDAVMTSTSPETRSPPSDSSSSSGSTDTQPLMSETDNTVPRDSPQPIVMSSPRQKTTPTATTSSSSSSSPSSPSSPGSPRPSRVASPKLMPPPARVPSPVLMPPPRLPVNCTTTSSSTPPEIDPMDTSANANATATTASSSDAATKGPRYCAECEDQLATVMCQQCRDTYCQLCYFALHRKGSRSTHVSQALPNAPGPATKQSTSNRERTAPPSPSTAARTQKTSASALNGSEDVGRGFLSFPFLRSNQKVITKPPPVSARDVRSKETESVLERAKYIPLRLTLEERKLLRLLEAILSSNKYTNRIDVSGFKLPAARASEQVKNITAVLTGLLAAVNIKSGQTVLASRDFTKHETFFQQVFEIGRRHKIMNPEKMRTQYTMLVYLLQDSCTPSLQEMLGINLIKPIVTVYSFLEQRGALGVLSDEYIVVATNEVVPAKNKTRADIQREIKTKERAIETIARRYMNGTKITPNQIKTCLYSICDNNSFLRCNRDPIDKTIEYLKEMFGNRQSDPLYSLAIYGGQDGSRLSHSHDKQYLYVLQSLTLWREIQHNMFKLWIMAEEDMLKPGNAYELKDTGQGLNRVQSSPQIYRAMHTILHTTQQRVGSWVGSSVIHLGDHNVPNALNFIDKYTQVPRILNPIIITLSRLDQLTGSKLVARYFQQTFGSNQELTRKILSDFFKHAFDGSGADNFYDAGSCIDGRLTSAWNWCNHLDQKEFYAVFLLSGFTGFDGEWK
ncbi:UPF0652 protein [Pelomyxa schiedti]|nr:UPF0652 protein [Pelomyxa schiedti]